jgi:hypothetical protein
MESYREYDSGNHSDVDMGVEDGVDALDCINFDSDVDMDRDSNDEWEENKEEEDEDEEDVDEDDGKEHRTIGQGEIVNTFADDVDTVVEVQ